jgi:deoxyhypusine synthase
MISSGLRGIFRYLVEHNHVSCIVTSAGGIEEDFIKCLGDTYMSSFSAKGADLRAKGLNRIGNLMVPNANYCAFEDWVVPILDKMLEEQEASKGTENEINWTPSKIIHRLGKEINDERSVYYWAYKNNIPVFCPALTDGSLGDMLYFHTFKASPRQLKIDIVEDIRRVNTISVRAKRAGMIILGGGVIKHHIANACLMRNGAEYAVYINTGQEFDGSDAGARPDEAISWGKIKPGADHVKVPNQPVAFPGFRSWLINYCRYTWRLRRAFPLLWPAPLQKTVEAYCGKPRGSRYRTYSSIIHESCYVPRHLKQRGVNKFNRGLTKTIFIIMSSLLI